jgi:hypothetical protein
MWRWRWRPGLDRAVVLLMLLAVGPVAGWAILWRRRDASDVRVHLVAQTGEDNRDCGMPMCSFPELSDSHQRLTESTSAEHDATSSCPCGPDGSGRPFSSRRASHVLFVRSAHTTSEAALRYLDCQDDSNDPSCTSESPSRCTRHTRHYSGGAPAYAYRAITLRRRN